MAKTVDLDQTLLQNAMRLNSDLSESETIETALRLMIQVKGQENILSFQAKVELWPNYDYKAMRQKRLVDLQA